jgi:hypothetical protein
MLRILHDVYDILHDVYDTEMILKYIFTFLATFEHSFFEFLKDKETK